MHVESSSVPLPSRFPVLDAAISAIDLDQAVNVVLGWVERREPHYVNVCTSDIALKCHDMPELARVVNASGLSTPDGMPLVWIGRLRGFAVQRVYGPDLMMAVCRAGLGVNCRHYFYGSTPEVLRDLAANLSRRLPGLRVVGMHAPPFRPLTSEEEGADARMIDAADPDIVWCGLGTLKQDFWVSRFREKVKASVLIAVGAAFAFHAGHLRQAPRWMMRSGLEWLFRLGVEPARLWRRYIIGNPRFVVLVLWQFVAGRPKALVGGEVVGRRAAPRSRRDVSGSQVAGTSDGLEAFCPEEEAETPRVNVLGVGISVTNRTRAARAVCSAARAGRRGYVCVTSVHGVVESLADPSLRSIHNASLLTVPDGMPTVWFGQECGCQDFGRVYGPDLMRDVFKITSAPDGHATVARRHYLCGSTPEVLERLENEIRRQYPRACLVGRFSPPFRTITGPELETMAAGIRDASPDFVWIGLSTPKQERLMAALMPKLERGVLIGVGAAFDILAGIRADAPVWMQRNGLQWCFRLFQEPRRLARRYLRIVPSFLLHASLQLLGIRRYELRETGDVACPHETKQGLS